LYEYGCRRGESLQQKVEDFDLHSRLVKIHRSADDIDDPRKVQPRTKTLSRSVPISAQLAGELYDYIDRIWYRIPTARRRHGYLWTTVDGDPLALSTVNDMFRRLRENVEGLPPNLTPHTLRHDWNERFSEAIDALPPDRRPGEEKEQATRAHMMGWSANSEMPRIYTRRFVREKAGQIMEEMTRPPKKPLR
jgi:integrase